MSRYAVHGNNSHYDITVGYDDPLDEFFAQVEDDRMVGDTPTYVLIGTSGIMGTKSLGEFADFIRQFTVVPDGLLERLALEQEIRRDNFGEDDRPGCKSLLPAPASVFWDYPDDDDDDDVDDDRMRSE